METSKKLLASVIGVVAVVGGVLLYKTAHKEAGDEATPSPSPSTSPLVTPTKSPTPTPTATVESSTYKNGTYSSEGNYTNPAGAEHINVTLTLKDDVIVDAAVTSTATQPTTVKMHAQFIAGYKPLVIGKKIDDVMLTKVSGSSLTPKGFNDAVAEIKLQAKS